MKSVYYEQTEHGFYFHTKINAFIPTTLAAALTGNRGTENGEMAALAGRRWSPSLGRWCFKIAPYRLNPIYHQPTARPRLPARASALTPASCSLSRCPGRRVLTLRQTSREVTVTL